MALPIEYLSRGAPAVSIAVMNLVWQTAPYQGNSLLALLALADWSDDDGLSWPGLEKLAKKSRQSERNARIVLRQMQVDGYLLITERYGTSSTYQINLAKLMGGKLCPLKKSARGGQRAAKTAALFAPYTSVEPSVDSYRGILCFKCEGKKQIFNYGPGPRIIPCPECQSAREA